MNLHEIYETLLRRGMSEHPELVWRDHGMLGPWTMDVWAGDAESEVVADLLAMHALRWINSGPRMNHGCATDGDAMTVLRWIVDVTAHLEPK
jgi:hypothetical protein